MHRVVAQPVVHAQAPDLEQDLGGAHRAAPGAARGAADDRAAGDPAAHDALREAGSTGVRPSTGRPGSPARRARRPAMPPEPPRSRGLTNSSIPKLSSASPVPNSPTASPGGTNHHHSRCTCWAAWAPCAQYSIVPQLQWEVLITPRKDSAV